jgi:Xaa-Pro aminopeptidase
MSDFASRITNRVSDNELRRRWALARAMMKDLDVDALLVQGANHVNGVNGHFQWLTGRPINGSYPDALLFPVDGLSTLVTHGPSGGPIALDGKDPSAPGIGTRIATPSFPMAPFTASNDADAISREVQRRGYRRIGLVSPDTMYFGFLARVKERHGKNPTVDVTAELDLLRADKSAEEVTFIRRAAAVQDDIMRHMLGFLRPGLKDRDVMAEAENVAKKAGCAGGYFLGSSATPGRPANMLPYPYHERTIEKGDVVLLQAENSGPGGYFVHMCRYFVLGPIPPELEEGFAATAQAQAYTVSLLKPGAKPSEIFESYNAYMRAHQLPEEGRLHCHGQGYDVVEPPLMRQEEQMRITGTMNIGLHPRAWNEHMFATCCDNFLVHPDDRTERLHQIEQRIFRVD